MLRIQDTTVANYDGLTFGENAIKFTFSDGELTTDILLDNQTTINANDGLITLDDSVEEWTYIQYVTYAIFGVEYEVQSATYTMPPCSFPSVFFTDGDAMKNSISTGIVARKAAGTASNGWLGVTDGSDTVIDGPYDISTAQGIADLQTYVESIGGVWDATTLTWTGAVSIPLYTETVEKIGFMPVDSGHRDDVSIAYDAGTKIHTYTYDTGFVIEVDTSGMTTKAGAHNPGSASILSSGPILTGSGGWAGALKTNIVTIPTTIRGGAPNIRLNTQFLDFDDQGSLTRSGSAADVDSWADDTNYLEQSADPNVFEYTSATDNLNRQFLQTQHITGYEFCTPTVLAGVNWNSFSIDTTTNGDFIFTLAPGDLGSSQWDGINYTVGLFIEYPGDVVEFKGTIVEAVGLDGSALSQSQIDSLCYKA